MTVHLVIQSPALGADHVEQAAAMAQANGVQRMSATAARLRAVNDDADTRHALRQWSEQVGVDIAFVPAGRALADCKILAMDMDSTLINIECIDELADLAGVKHRVSEITEAAMRGEIKDFSESLRRRVALLTGASAEGLDTVYAQRLRLNPGAEELISTAQAAGIKVLLVSGGFTFFTSRLQARLKLDAAYANELEVIDGKYTGQVQGRILDAQAKLDYLNAFAAEHGATPEQIIAIGDGANDLKMLGAAGYAVAYRAKPIVREQTPYAINVCGLDAVLNWFEH